MILVFLGAPGSGKGTQAKIISKKLDLAHYSTGDMLRSVASKDTPLGKELSNVMSSGSLVDDALVNKIVVSSLNDIRHYKGCILDGYPRTPAQAKFLDDVEMGKVFTIYFDIDSELLKARITKRYTCKTCGAIYNEILSPTKKENVCDKCGGTEFDRRSDDNEEALLKRIEVFENNKNGLLEYYSKNGALIKVDASLEVGKVTNLILDGIKNH